jgi:hypothetical protein
MFDPDLGNHMAAEQGCFCSRFERFMNFFAQLMLKKSAPLPDPQPTGL